MQWKAKAELKFLGTIFSKDKKTLHFILWREDSYTSYTFIYNKHTHIITNLGSDSFL